MLLGLIDDKNRSRPSYTGQRATCPFCKGELIAKCGDIYINHWQHKSLPDCDSWKENEGEWHKAWKAHFPEENQEVIITVGSEKHIADIKTNKGIVIEFQNSSISSGTIAIRENFYGNMIWVVNAAHFVENLKIRSVVTHQLRFNKDAFTHELSDSDTFYDEAIKGYKDRIREWQRTKQQLQWKLDSANSDLNSSKEAINSFDVFLEELLSKLHTSALFQKFPLKEVHDAITDELKQRYKTCLSDIERLSREKKESENWLEAFSKYTDLHADQIDYKIIPPTVLINSDSFANIFAILKDEKSSMFPNVISFRNKMDFDRMKGNSNYFLMAKKLDFEEGRKSKISNLQNQLNELSETKCGLLNEIKVEVIKQLDNSSNECEKIISGLNEEISECNTVIRNISESLNDAEKSKVSEHESILKSIESKQKASDIEIMKKYKGLYLFEWKNERKSWRNSKKTIYLDIGEDYLFEIYQEYCLRKVDKQTFIKMHLTDK